MVWLLTRLSMGTALVIAPPAPVVRAFVDAVDPSIREQRPHHGMAARQRAWLACCVTAVLVTNAMCWARLARASLGTYALAALAWMCRHRTIPWDALVVASGRVILRHDGLTCGRLVSDESDHKRSKSATTLAHLYKLRDQERGGDVWGQRLVVLLVVTPDLTRPGGLAFDQPAPERSAWYTPEKALKKPEVPPKQRPPKPPPHPYDPPTHALARRLLAQVTAAHPTFRVPCLTADALYGTATCVDGAAALFGGVPGISPLRSTQKVRVHKRDQHVADYVATPPGTPPHLRIRGGEEGVVRVGRARLSVCSHHTTRCSGALTYADEATSRALRAADLTWRTLDLVPGHTRRWLVEVLVQDGKSPEGWRQLTKQPGDEGARRRVILRLLGAHGLFYHPDQQTPFTRHLPAYTVGRLRAHGPVEGLVNVIETLMSSDAPQEHLLRFTHAVHAMFAFSRSKKPMIQRQWGRLAPTPSLTDRADEVMRNIPGLSI